MTTNVVSPQVSKRYLSRHTYSRSSLKALLTTYYPLICICVGYLLVAFSTGPYHNGDTSWEYDAVAGVRQYGMPYANGMYLMDQPPVGFYIQAAFFDLVGASFGNGAALVTLFGLGCVALVYFIGKILYNPTMGFFASLLFAFSPWHLVLSRSFLIDVPCLFFSLLSLAVATVAVRRGSFWLFAASGVIFAVAFNTKLYAVFVIIPLIAAFLYWRRGGIGRMAGWLAAFSLPVLAFSFIWYNLIAKTGLTSIFLHSDFFTQSVDLVPSYFFVPNFLVSYGLGWLFIDAALLSVFFSLAWRGVLRRYLVFDAVCLALIASVIGVNTFLGTTLDLHAPYMNAIKYDYQALPFFALLVAGLVSKGMVLYNLSASKAKSLLFKAAAIIGLVLAAAAVLYNMQRTNLFSTVEYLIFRVEPTVDAGYSLFNFHPTAAGSALMAMQYLGYAVALSGLLWISRHRIGALAMRLTGNKP
ncbi:MAG: glycosyltransferase family 39 protein [Candidatus Bathyarchaeota archaeon]|nr:glycosyltransferase family 39 protein [Candidatus Bathyarchaeota archaeon]